MILTLEQSNLLFDVKEHHLKWYKKNYPSPPEFDTLLELNHIKLKKCFPKGHIYTLNEVTEKLLEFKQHYIDMLMGLD